MPGTACCALRVLRLLKRRHSPRENVVEVFMDGSLLGWRELAVQRRPATEIESARCLRTHSSGENRYFDGGVPAEVYADFFADETLICAAAGLAGGGDALGMALEAAGRCTSAQGNEAGGWVWRST
jgi:hypothetical protein